MERIDGARARAARGARGGRRHRGGEGLRRRRDPRPERAARDRRHAGDGRRRRPVAAAEVPRAAVPVLGDRGRCRRLRPAAPRRPRHARGRRHVRRAAAAAPDPPVTPTYSGAMRAPVTEPAVEPASTCSPPSNRARRRDPAAPDPRAAQRPARDHPRPVGAVPARLPRDHRRVRRHGGDRRHPVDHRRHRQRLLQYTFGVADPVYRPADAARRWRAAHRRRDGGPGDHGRVRRVRRRERRLAHRRRAAAPGRQRAPRRAVPAARGSGPRSRPTSRAATSARSSSARRGAGDRRVRLAGLGRDAGRRRARGRDRRSSRSSGRRATTGPPRADGPVRAHLPARPRRPRPALAVHRRGARRRSRGLGVLNIFVPLYLDQVVGLDAPTIGAMYAVLLVLSVPGAARRRLAVRPDRPAAGHRRRLSRRRASIAVFVLAGDDLLRLWFGIVLLSAFSFVESPQLQALLADVTPPASATPRSRLYFALAFGVGSCWGIALRAADRPRRVGQRPAARVLGHGRGVGAGGRRDPPDPDPAEGQTLSM